MLSLNFMDPNSLMTWLEMRRMALDVGLRFSMRVSYGLATFVAVCFLHAGLLLGKGFNRLTAFDGVFSKWHWIICIAQLFLMLVFCVPALISAAYINENAGK
jgi:hypothetical protein